MEGLFLGLGLCWRLFERKLLRRARRLLLRLRNHVFGDELRLETDDSVRVGDDGLGVVLGLVASAARLSVDDESSFAGSGPVGRALGRHTAVGDEPFGMADLMCRGFAKDKMRILGRQVIGLISGKLSFFMDAASLTLVERDKHRNGRVQGLLHQDVVELRVIEAEHI